MPWQHEIRLGLDFSSLSDIHNYIKLETDAQIEPDELVDLSFAKLMENTIFNSTNQKIKQSTVKP